MNKDTTICCSFSSNPTNKGCEFFNTRFEERKMNWAYKAFKIDNIEHALQAMRTLNFRGAGVSMPFKTECLRYVDNIPEEVKEIGAANTIVNDAGKLTAYNTDWLAARSFISKHVMIKHKEIIIFGNGGLAKAVQYACKQLGFQSQTWTRNKFDDLFNLRESCIFNCTPVPHLDQRISRDNFFIDCIIGTKSGNELASRQAEHQWNLYTKGYENETK